MSRCWQILAAVAILTVSASSLAAEKYTLKAGKPDVVGERTKVVSSERTDNSMTLRSGGAVVQEQKEQKDQVATFIETVLSMDGDQITKRSRKYESVKRVKDGKVVKLDLVGKVVIIERMGTKYSFTYEGGGEITGDTLAYLSDEFKEKDNKNEKLDKIMMAKDPVAVGETWMVNAKDMVAALDKAMVDAIDLKAATITGKLTKVYSKNGARYGIINIVAKLPVVRVGPAGMAIPTDAGSNFTMRFDLDICTDGTLTDGTMTVTLTGAMGATIKSPDGKEFIMKVNIEGNMTQTQSPVK